MTVQKFTRQLIVAISENVGLDYHGFRHDPLDWKPAAVDLRPDAFNNHAATPLYPWL
jgi:hypothetical protein